MLASFVFHQITKIFFYNLQMNRSAICVPISEFRLTRFLIKPKELTSTQNPPMDIKIIFQTIVNFKKIG